MAAVGTIRIARATLIARSAAQPVNPVCLSGGRTRLAPAFPRHVPRQPKPGLPGHAINAPTLHFGPVPAPFFRARNHPVLRAKVLHPWPQPADGVVVSEPFWDDRRGPKTHSRRTGIKLGDLRCARQALVRVPESNTKYGGKRGITGADRAPVMGTSISESSQIPKDKKLFGGPNFSLHPLFTGQVFIRVFRAFRDCTWETHVGLRRTPLWHAGEPVVAGRRKRQSRRR